LTSFNKGLVNSLFSFERLHLFFYLFGEVDFSSAEKLESLELSLSTPEDYFLEFYELELFVSSAVLLFSFLSRSAIL
jgi:hypothetical protein